MSFRRLSHAFTFGSNDPSIRDHVGRLLERFAVRDGPRGGANYEVLDLGPEEPSRFKLLINGKVVLAGGRPVPILDELFTRLNRDTVEVSRECVVVHAGAVVTPEGVGIVLPAPSGSGKTTLTAGLIRAGFGYLSEEAAVLDSVTGTLHPYPVHFSLRGETRTRLLDRRPDSIDLDYSSDTWHIDPATIRAGALASSCEVGFVIAHRYVPHAETQVDPLTRAEVCADLARNLMLGRGAVEGSLDLLARVCRRSKGYQLTHGNLDEAVEAIIALTQPEGATLDGLTCGDVIRT